MKPLLVIQIVLWVLTVVGLYVAHVRRKKQRQAKVEHEELGEYAASFDALAETYQALKEAKSAGQFYGTHINGRFKVV